MKPQYPIEIDYSRDDLFEEMGMRRLRDSYLADDETSPQERFAYVSAAFASNEAHAKRMYNYASRHWVSFATPILAFKGSKEGMPISCFLSYVHDSKEGLVDALAEIAVLSMGGGGVGIGLGIRSEDSKSVGIGPHQKVFEAVSLAYRQGKTRRGSFAGYLDIDHPNMQDHLDLRKPTGDQSKRCMELHHAFNISDDFMQRVEACMMDPDADDRWELRDPHTGAVKEVVSVRNTWEQMLETRMRTGEPFMHFIDASNRAMPWYQQAKGLKIVQSNICTEITLPTDKDRTAVCCLSSPNLEYWDDWKNDPLFLDDLGEFLDNCLQYYIDNASERAKRAAYSAMRERAIGVGAIGFHALLQKKMIAFESPMAKGLNITIFQHIRKSLDACSVRLAHARGPCPDAADYGVMERFSCKMAVAPNASTSIVMNNTSASVEPIRANAVRQDTLSGSFILKNRRLDEILKNRFGTGDYYDEIWRSIVKNAGSVQHLDEELTERERNIFKTASELDQMWIIEFAADRQKFIDQAQSINIFFKADVSVEYLHHVHFMAWKKGLKTLYYCRSDKLYSGEGNQRRKVVHNFQQTLDEGCIACEG